MMRILSTTTLAAGLAAAGVATAAVTAGAAGPPPATSASRFSQLAGQATHTDYVPLRSAADALRQGDLVVRGTVRDVTDGIQAAAPGAPRQGNQYATLVVAVSEVLDGRHDPAAPLYVVLSKSAQADASQLARAGRGTEVVLVLQDVTGWRPRPGATVVRPATVPATARLYAPYTDGIWLQGSADSQAFGVGAEPADLTAGWRGVRTLDGLTTELRAARGR